MKKKKQCVVMFCAHNDDQTIGAGGTIRKYIDEGIDVYTYIFSYGESSHPHLKPEVVAEMREKESIRAAKILGDKIHYFGLKEGKFLETYNSKDIKKIIKDRKPIKIFTHSPDDAHPDHRAVYKIITDTLREIKYKRELYSFDVWHIFSLKTREYPKLFIDISNTFKHKVNALKKHKSQLLAILALFLNIYIKATMHGWNNHCKYAELFHKIELEK